MDFTHSVSVMPRERTFMKIYDNYLTTPKTCGYTTLKNNCFQKLCRRSTVTSAQTCLYWRECKHNL